MIYDEHQGGMLCSVCTKYGKPPIQARGAWVTRAINNWPKATDLLPHAANNRREKIQGSLVVETASLG